MRFFWGGLVALLFVFESIANSAFLAKGNELGLVGAYTVAFGVSIANLVRAFDVTAPDQKELYKERMLLLESRFYKYADKNLGDET